MRAWRGVLVVAGAVLAGCPKAPDGGGGDGGGGSDMAAPAGVVTVMATPAAGATLKSSDGRFTLTVPPGGVSAATELSLETLTADKAPSSVPAGVRFKVGPEGLQFVKPATVDWALSQAEFDALKTPDGRPGLWLWTLSGAGKAEVLGKQQLVEGTSPSLRAEVTHLSEFAAQELPVKLGAYAPSMQIPIGGSGDGMITVTTSTLRKMIDSAWDRFWSGHDYTTVNVQFVIDSYKLEPIDTGLRIAPLVDLTGKTVSGAVQDKPRFTCDTPGNKLFRAVIIGRIKTPDFPAVEAQFQPIGLVNSDVVRCAPPDMAMPDLIPADLKVLPDLTLFPRITDVVPIKGRPGDFIEIQGSNLETTMEVTVYGPSGSASATLSLVASDKVRFQVPNLPSDNYQLLVNTDNGITHWLTPFFQVLPGVDMAAPAGDMVVDKCTIGWLDCDNNMANGCETNGNNDNWNCGACNRLCKASGTNSNLCVNGVCNPICAMSYAQCGAPPHEGCPVQISDDNNNCGSCGTKCTLPNASASCSNFMCTFVQCNPIEAYGNCNGDGSDGCEKYLLDDNNCGYCGQQCMNGQHCNTNNNIVFFCL